MYSQSLSSGWACHCQEKCCVALLVRSTMRTNRLQANVNSLLTKVDKLEKSVARVPERVIKSWVGRENVDPADLHGSTATHELLQQAIPHLTQCVRTTSPGVPE